jgi:hypothetical protein
MKNYHIYAIISILLIACYCSLLMALHTNALEIQPTFPVIFLGGIFMLLVPAIAILLAAFAIAEWLGTVATKQVNRYPRMSKTIVIKNPLHPN